MQQEKIFYKFHNFLQKLFNLKMNQNQRKKKNLNFLKNSKILTINKDLENQEEKIQIKKHQMQKFMYQKKD